MTEFKREERYWVVKFKDLSDEQRVDLGNYLACERILTRECVVVESDWPIYNDVWDMVQRMAEGLPQEVDTVAAGRRNAQRIASQALNERDDMAHLLEEALTGLQWYRDAHPESDSGTDDEFFERVNTMLSQWRECTPTTSLARLKAQWQAEKLDDMASSVKRWGASDLVAEAIRLRRQAEGTSCACREAQVKMEGAASFKAELLSAFRTFAHPHIEGVFAVWERRQVEGETNSHDDS